MDPKLIEELDRRRYKNLLRFTILSAIGFPLLLILPELMIRAKSDAAIIITLLSGIVISVLCVVFIIRFSRNIHVKNPELKIILDNELIQLYILKSIKWGFLAAMIVAFLLYAISGIWQHLITVRFACMAIMYTGIMTGLIARLIYMRK